MDKLSLSTAPAQGGAFRVLWKWRQQAANQPLMGDYPEERCLSETLMNTFKARPPKNPTRLAAKCLAFAISAMAASAYADAPEQVSSEPNLEHIATSAKKTMGGGLTSFKGFSVSQTPCYIRGGGMIEQDIPGLRRLFAEAGINVTTDKKAKCSIAVSGYVTLPRPDSDGVVAQDAEFVIANRDAIGTVQPAIAGTNDSTEGAADNAKYMESSITGGDIEHAVSASNMLGGGIKEGIAATVALGILSTITSASARSKTPTGLANISAHLTMKPGVFLTAVHSMSVHAASPREETPEDLLRAAVRRFVAEFQTVVDTSNGKDANPPENVAAVAEDALDEH